MYNWQILDTANAVSGLLCYEQDRLVDITPENYYTADDPNPLVFSWPYYAYGCGLRPSKIDSAANIIYNIDGTNSINSRNYVPFPAWSPATNVAPYTALATLTVKSTELDPPLTLGDLSQGRCESRQRFWSDRWLTMFLVLDALLWGPYAELNEGYDIYAYWEANHTMPDALQRRHRQRRWQEAVDDARPLTAQEILRTTGKQLDCPRNGMVACPAKKLGSYEVST